MVILGNQTELKKYEEFMIKKYEKYLENKGDGLVDKWITDDINKYCYISELEKGLSILDTKYEDFMLDYIKHKNNVVPTEAIKNQFSE